MSNVLMVVNGIVLHLSWVREVIYNCIQQELHNKLVQCKTVCDCTCTPLFFRADPTRTGVKVCANTERWMAAYKVKEVVAIAQCSTQYIPQSPLVLGHALRGISLPSHHPHQPIALDRSPLTPHLTRALSPTN